MNFKQMKKSITLLFLSVILLTSSNAAEELRSLPIEEGKIYAFIASDTKGSLFLPEHASVRVLKILTYPWIKAEIFLKFYVQDGDKTVERNKQVVFVNLDYISAVKADSEKQ